VAGDDVDFDHHEAGLPTADEELASFGLLTRSAEALHPSSRAGRTRRSSFQ
jgi:hypothetical protein